MAPPRVTSSQPQAAPRAAAGRRRRPIWSVVFFILLISGVGIRAYRDLSRPEAWAYWKESYFSPSMTSSLIANAELEGSARGRRTLAITGTIGAATASWLRERLDEAHLAAGDVVLLSSPGGNLDQAIIMGEIIRARAGDGSRHRRRFGPRQPILLCQRLRARLCRRQAALRNRRLGAGGPQICDLPARSRPRRRNPADCGNGLELFDQDGRVVIRRGGDVRDPGRPLARPEGILGDESHHRSDRKALNRPPLI